MPIYEYMCPANGLSVEVVHPMSHRVRTWGELCTLAEIERGDTPADAPVEKLLYAPGITTPQGNSDLKNMGFTKLVRRDKGVYENVTRRGDESRYMNAGDSSTAPDLKKTIRD
jgi:predicted nucleic acid-binding Zn ribbon protein